MFWSPWLEATTLQKLSAGGEPKRKSRLTGLNPKSSLFPSLQIPSQALLIPSQALLVMLAINSESCQEAREGTVLLVMMAGRDPVLSAPRATLDCAQNVLPSTTRSPECFEAQARQQHGGEEEEGEHYIPAAFLHIQCPPYEDPPPPYSPPKPPHILPADAPPPYEELESHTPSFLDANANVSNNNINNNNNSDNNHQSCGQHRQRPRSPPGGDSQQTSSNQSQRASTNQNARVVEAAEALNSSSEGSCVDSCSSQGGKSSSSCQGREEGTEMTVMSRRQSYSIVSPPPPPTCPPSPAPAGGASVRTNSGGGVGRQQSQPNTAHRSADSAPRHTNSDGRGAWAGAGGKRGGGGGGRGSGKTGRSCSFSLSRTERDESVSGGVLGPMSHSYHSANANTNANANTADSGVQTHGSYTASLSRHKGRLGVEGERAGERRRSGGEGVGGGAVQRMVTKPMVTCDMAVQLSHRMLQEELRRNLPHPTAAAATTATASPTHTPPPPPPSSSSSSSLPKSVSNAAERSGPDQTDGTTASGGGQGCGGGGGPTADHRACAPSGCPDNDDDLHPDPEAVGVGSWVGSAGSGFKASLPRSQSVASAFSVCSETGEVHVKKGCPDPCRDPCRDPSVLHSDCQYPPQHRSSPSKASPTPSQWRGAVPTPIPTPTPASQELRPSLPRGQSAKPKHRRIHLPLDKGKTSRVRKEKVGGGKKKGEGERRSHEAGRTSGGGGGGGGGTPPMGLHPPWEQVCAQQAAKGQPPWGVGEGLLRGRLAASCVKQYGFVDPAPPLFPQQPQPPYTHPGGRGSTQLPTTPPPTASIPPAPRRVSGAPTETSPGPKPGRGRCRWWRRVATSGTRPRGAGGPKYHRAGRGGSRALRLMAPQRAGRCVWTRDRAGRGGSRALRLMAPQRAGRCVWTRGWCPPLPLPPSPCPPSAVLWSV
ncbi:hypothetical protein ACOMHN_023471 [Nucella lapillus]